jgi:hypothetical protein
MPSLSPVTEGTGLAPGSGVEPPPTAVELPPGLVEVAVTTTVTFGEPGVGDDVTTITRAVAVG